mgnify:FL=1
MITERGKSVYKGVAIGKISVHKSGEQTIKRVHVEDIEAEKQRFFAAKEKAQEQLMGLYNKALAEVGD